MSVAAAAAAVVARVASAVPVVVPADVAVGSAASASASSARRRSTTSTTRTCGCCRQFVPERGKIQPRRLTGTSAKYQRKLQVAIKRARFLALLPYATD